MFENQHLLYVEDDPLSREVMTMMIENVIQPQTFTMMEDSHDFQERVRTISPSPTLVLLDIHVQPHDGFEMLTMIREIDHMKDVHIVALTASVMNEEVEKLREHGFNGAIGKPLSIQLFPSLISRILEGEQVWHIAD